MPIAFPQPRVKRNEFPPKRNAQRIAFEVGRWHSKRNVVQMFFSIDPSNEPFRVSKCGAVSYGSG